MCDIGEGNVLNRDNRIFKTGLVFVYKIFFKDSLDKPQTLCLTPSILGKVVDKLYASEEATNRKYCINKIRLSVFNGKGETNLGNTQTIIKYEYYEDEKRVFFGEKTGVVEDSSRVFLHPPRNYYLFYNEFNPFPQVLFPIEEHDYWELEFGIPSHFLQMVPGLKDSSLTIRYKLIAKELYESSIGIDSVYRFEASGVNSEIATKSSYLFSKKNGFVKMQFLTLKGAKIVMELEDVITK